MIHVDNLHLRIGNFCLEGVSFEVPTGKYAVLMGKTGSGKTTLLEAIAGLKTIDSGSIVLGDADATRLKPAERHIGFVPQDGALFHTMSVRSNLAFALSVRRVSRSVAQRRVEELAGMLEIAPLLDRQIAGLSGGEQQRVALGRALAFRPTTLCLDEPLAALDEATREQIVELLKRVQHETGVTTLHITHNRHEAESLADVYLELADGQVRRLERPNPGQGNGAGPPPSTDSSAGLKSAERL